MVKICQNCVHWVSFTLGRIGAAWPSMNFDTGFCYKGTEEASASFKIPCTRSTDCCDNWEFSEINARKGEENELL